jgi:hypothetical protein
MNFTILPSHLHAFAESANFVIKNRYGLNNGIVEKAMNENIPLQPTLHWKTPTHFIACEVAERPFPTAIKTQFADIVASGLPIRIIVAYPSENTLSAADYQRDIKNSKMFGIGFMSVDEKKHGKIEYKGISLALHISEIDVASYHRKIQPFVLDAYEHYMMNGDPDVGLQKIGQLVEDIILDVAIQAKKAGNFTEPTFRPPRYMAHSTLIDFMINERILGIPILGRCRDFAIDRNSVSHKPRTIKDAIRIEKLLKDNIAIGLKILRDLPALIKTKGYKLNC